MDNHSIDFFWRDPQAVRRFRTGVCLHGHTMHSEECLSFLPRYLHHVPGVSQIVSGYEHGPKAIDFARAYWTPPLTPACALSLEQKQIAGLGFRPLVSLTDHDNIDAGMSLQLAADPREVPVSVEWTAPYGGSILHLGIHNLPSHTARGWLAAMSAYTSAPDEGFLSVMLRELSRIPDILIVLNHPFWLEEGVEENDHRRALDRVLSECLEWLHAFELNGTRGWQENVKVIELARNYSRPLVSGGDRHACEPSACLNLTNADSFSEFAAEVRAGHSSILFLPQYRESMAYRVLEMAWDILRPYPEYAGREQWTDRFFYRGQAGDARSLTALWQDRVPWIPSAATGLLQLCATTRLRLALRLLLAERGEILP